MTRRPNAYDRGQHDLICRALDISPDPEASGSTAYEGVCVLLMKLNAAEAALKKVKTKEARETVKYIKADHDSETFSILQCFGTGKP